MVQDTLAFPVAGDEEFLFSAKLEAELTPFLRYQHESGPNTVERDSGDTDEWGLVAFFVQQFSR